MDELPTPLYCIAITAAMLIVVLFCSIGSRGVATNEAGFHLLKLLFAACIKSCISKAAEIQSSPAVVHDVGV